MFAECLLYFGVKPNYHNGVCSSYDCRISTTIFGACSQFIYRSYDTGTAEQRLRIHVQIFWRKEHRITGRICDWSLITHTLTSFAQHSVNRFAQHNGCRTPFDAAPIIHNIWGGGFSKGLHLMQHPLSNIFGEGVPKKDYIWCSSHYPQYAGRGFLRGITFDAASIINYIWEGSSSKGLYLMQHPLSTIFGEGVPQRGYIWCSTHCIIYYSRGRGPQRDYIWCSTHYPVYSGRGFLKGVTFDAAPIIHYIRGGGSSKGLH